MQKSGSLKLACAVFLRHFTYLSHPCSEQLRNLFYVFFKTELLTRVLLVVSGFSIENILFFPKIFLCLKQECVSRTSLFPLHFFNICAFCCGLKFNLSYRQQRKPVLYSLRYTFSSFRFLIFGSTTTSCLWSTSSRRALRKHGQHAIHSKPTWVVAIARFRTRLVQQLTDRVQLLRRRQLTPSSPPVHERCTGIIAC